MALNVVRLTSAARRLRAELVDRAWHSRSGQQLLRVSRPLRAPHVWLSNRLEARRFRTPSQHDVDRPLGFRAVELDALPAFQPALRVCAERLERLRPRLEALTQAYPDRFGVTFDLFGDDQLAASPALLDLALDQRLVGVAARYLGTLPVLRRIALGYSRGSAHAPMGSQCYHFDAEDRTQLKLFVAVTPVSEEDGPTSFHAADASQRIAPALIRTHSNPPGARVHGPFGDEQVEALVGAPLNRMVGPPGTALWLDTSRCLHYGSRVPAGRERCVLMLAYRRFPALHESPFNTFPARGTDPAWRRAVLRPPRRLPRGWYFPDPADRAGPAQRGRVSPATST